jgi:CYTH domain-containing protein
VEGIDLLQKLRVEIRNALGALTTSITSGSIDNIESYKYNVGQIKAYEAILQEISNLLEKKEQYEKHTGQVIDIKKQPKY